jgi:alpha-N-arabinofuranosidase
MDIKDPGKRINLVVDEWGTWYPVEPGTNPGFLYQQNTVRDALVASVHLDGFHRHCKRVRMTNIAQMVNVLQAMILTKGEQILLTPTYWVFEMYVPHQDAKRIDLALETGEADAGIPAVSATASEKNGKITVSASNLDIAQPQTIEITGLPTSAKVVRARILAGPTVQSHNTFEAPETVQPVPFEVTASEGRISLELPPASIVSVELEA